MSKRIPIIQEGWYYILSAFFLMLLLWYIYESTSSTLFKYIFFISIICFILTLNFFRDPERKINLKNKNLLVSPADGTITAIEYNYNEQQYRKDMSIRISIFMSIFNVHIQRMPISGTIKYINYKKGEFISAFESAAELRNEQNWIGFETDNKTKITVVQIAGLIARRIVRYINLNDYIETGKRIGHIRFGSRVDIYLPVNTEIFVQVGDKIKGNVTVLGKLK